MRRLATLATVSLLALAAGSAEAQQKQVVTGPVATYWMSAATTSGFGAGMGAAPSMSQIMGMMNGGGAQASHSLILQLGSARKAPAPAAEHLPPAALRAGPSLPLVTPVAQPSQRVEETPDVPRDFTQPKGKILIFWGCGEHARPGQPLVIDLAQIAAGKAPNGIAALGRGLNITPMTPPSPGRNATYGEWPNPKGRTSVPGNGSLIGDHVIRGNYSPEMRFTLGAGQDFLSPLNLVRNDITPTGAGQLNWAAVPGAQAYMATAMGGRDDGTMVMWSSSEVQTAAFALPDYLSNPDLSRLVTQKALMVPATLACTIPQEVVKAAPEAMVNLAAYGAETNLSWPPRPADPKQPWNIDWTLKVRYRAQTGAMLGMEMPGMDASSAGRSQPAGRPGQSPPPAAPGLGDLMRSIGRLPGM
jgi:hypothetical protein